MLRLLALLALAAAALGQTSSSDEQRRAFEEYQRILQAQRQFGEIHGFSRPIAVQPGGYAGKLSERSKASFVSVTTLAAPKKARNAFLKAERALLQQPQQLEKAETALLQAVESHESYAAAWSLLGKIQLAEGRRDEARTSFLRAVAADPGFLEPHADLARLRLEDNDWAGLEASARVMTRTNPHFTLGHLYLGVAYFNQNAPETAEKHALNALATEDVKLFPEVHHLLGQICEQRGDRRRAAEHFRAYMTESSPPEPWRTALQERIRTLETSP
jgi:tetratricopeptide (TPR) repeat protein